jgi:hypothetical protein
MKTENSLLTTESRRHGEKLLTYLKLSGKKVGLLFNFHVPALKDGIVRLVA